MAKLFLILVLSSVLYANGTSLAQNISLTRSNITFQEAFKEIKKQTGYNFLWAAENIKSTETIQVSLVDVPLEKAINTLLEGLPLTYQLKKKTILIVEKREVIASAPPAPLQSVVSGIVTDTTGLPLPGVSVTIKGQGSGTTTDVNGQYRLQKVSEEDVLVFSLLGYETQEASVMGRNEVNISMHVNIAGLDEVVVVGYGTQLAEEVTGAVSTVNEDDFNQGSVTDAAELIQGKVAGLNVITPNANPSSTSQINLRGVITLMSGSQPLVLIDGVPGDLNEVSPEEIESINVLKDGSAAAIYGTRGSNGVILLTTKSVKGDIAPTISVKSELSVQSITKKLDFMDAGEYRQKVQEGLPGAIDQGANTDWLSEVTQMPFSQIHDISLKGGNRTSSYIVSLRYSDQNGIMRKSYDTRLYPRFEVNHSMFDGMLTVSANLNAYTQESFAGSSGGGYNSAVYYNALIYNPTAPLKSEDGRWFQNLGRHAYDNPVALLEETNGINENNKLKYYGTATFKPIKSLSLRVLGSRDITKRMLGYYETKAHTSTLRNGRNGFAARSSRRIQEDLFEATLEYDRTFSQDHNLSALIGNTLFYENYQNFGLQNWDFPTDDYDYNLIETGLALTRGEANQSSYQSESKLVSYFFRLNYNFRGKYLFAASIRREGSSKFGINNKWADFPAVSAGWNLHRESFLSSFPALSRLKLRAGFGVTGTIPDDPYLSLSTLNFNTFSYINGDWIQTIEPTSNPNPNLRWETKEEINLGIDFGFLDERFSGSIDLYQRTTRDMIWNYSVPTPPYLYNFITANAATMKNKGLEINLNALVTETPDFRWNSTINYSTNKNKVVSLTNDNFQLASGFFDVGDTGEPILQKTHRVEIGEPIGNFFGYRSTGVDDDGHWLIEGENGASKPISEQTADDKQILGNGLPDHYLNWNNVFTYKNFDLNIQMRGAFGFQILNMPRMFYEAPIMLTRGNVLSSTFNPINGQPLALDQELQYVSHYIEDGDYWKISNVTLGYNVDLKESTFFKSLRLTASGNNLGTITGYSGIDPEVNSIGLDVGVDHKYRYPAARTYTLGMSLIF